MDECVSVGDGGPDNPAARGPDLRTEGIGCRLVHAVDPRGSPVCPRLSTGGAAPANTRDSHG